METPVLLYKIGLVWFLFNVPVNNFSAMFGRSHRFLGIYQYLGGGGRGGGGAQGVLLKDTTRRSWGSNPGPLAPESDAIPLSNRAPYIKLGCEGVYITRTR